MKQIVLAASLVLSLLGGAGPVRAEVPKVLVYTRNYVSSGTGFVHDNIATCAAAIQAQGKENGFGVDVSDDPTVFTPDNLKQYKAIVFANSNNEAFATDAQRAAFQKFLKAGGGFVGIHSATGSERSWPYYWSVIGGKFQRHPKMQKFTIRVVDANHPATKGLPASFEWEDECYFHEYLNPDLHPLLVTDPTKLDDPTRAKHPGDLVGSSMPLAWYIKADGIRSFYTALGHKKEHYANPLLKQQILGGILWAMGKD